LNDGSSNDDPHINLGLGAILDTLVASGATLEFFLLLQWSRRL